MVIEVEAMLSIAHGTDGLCWFTISSYLYLLNKDSTTSLDGLNQKFFIIKGGNTGFYFKKKPGRN